jgi:ERCC4-type nuclease
MLSYWKAPNGPVERVYLQIAPNRRIYGQRVAGDRVAWRGDDMEPEMAEQTARREIGDLPSWSVLRRMVETAVRTAGVPARTAPDTPDQVAPVVGGGVGTHRRMSPSGHARVQRREDRRAARAAAPRIETPYDARDSQKLDTGALGSLPQSTHLVVDVREPREIAGILSRIGNLEVEYAPLERGRYMVDGCLLVDRISTIDLHRGIVDDPRPLLKRVSDLSDIDHAALFVVEGGIRTHRRASLEKIAGAVSYVSVVHRVPIVETIDVWETVYVIARAIGHACHPVADDLPQPHHRRGGRKDHRVSPRYVLEGIPGVSTVRAEIILERFGTLKEVAGASIEQLLDLPGLGPTVAQSVYDAFNVS